jgi:DNA-binding LacI/PurR family transcriptional regulator
MAIELSDYTVSRVLRPKRGMSALARQRIAQSADRLALPMGYERRVTKALPMKLIVRALSGTVHDRRLALRC